MATRKDAQRPHHRASERQQMIDENCKARASVHALVMLPMEGGVDILDPHSTLAIPQQVATCAYGDTPLTASFEASTQEDDGTWTATPLMLDCKTEPAMESDAWEAWRRWHAEMPDVYLLPVSERVKQWIKSKYRFDLEAA